MGKIDIGMELKNSLERLRSQKIFTPTGLMEQMISAVGECYGSYRMIVAQMPNKVGKTRHAIEILKKIIWPNCQQDYFDYPLYKKYPFVNIDGRPIKAIRIISDPTHLGDSGAIRQEIAANWPRGRYTEDKHGKHYVSHYVSDTGWDIDIMTYEQDTKEFESKLVSFQWLDEPADPKIIGAVTSRMSKGGVILMTFTPVNRNAGAVLDVLDDLQAQGLEIKRLSGSIEQNSSETGLLNSRGTMRGLMSDAEITEYIKGVPADEKDQRLYGKTTFKSGKVYGKIFDRSVHVRDYDLDSVYAKSWDNYMVCDPHRAYYPFLLWYGIAPDESMVIWNEYPTYKQMGNRFFDQIRNTEHYTTPISRQAEIIKLMDGLQFGMSPIRRRFIDPRFAAGTKNEWTKDTGGIIQEFLQYDVKFEMPPFEGIDRQRLVIQELLQYDKQLPVGGINAPRLFVMPHCVNVIRSLERHYYQDSTETEAEDYKDPIDCIRYGLAGMGGVRYRGTPVIPIGKPKPSADVVQIKKLHAWVEDMKGL